MHVFNLIKRVKGVNTFQKLHWLLCINIIRVVVNANSTFAAHAVFFCSQLVLFQPCNLKHLSGFLVFLRSQTNIQLDNASSSLESPSSWVLLISKFSMACIAPMMPPSGCSSLGHIIARREAKMKLFYSILPYKNNYT